MSNVEIKIDAGMIVLVRKVLHRNGKPKASIDDATDEIMAAVRDLQREAMAETPAP